MGRERRRIEVPRLAHLRPQEQRERTVLQRSRAALRAMPEEERKAAKKEHAVLSKRFRADRQRRRAKVIVELAYHMELAMQDGDLGRFYRSLRQVGVHLAPLDFSIQQEYTTTQARDHFLRLAGDANVVSLEILDDVPQQPVCEALDEDIRRDEFDLALQEMRDSAAGDDEVTVGLLRAAGSRAQEELWLLTLRLWNTPPSLWEPEIHRSAIILALERKRCPQRPRHVSGHLPPQHCLALDCPRLWQENCKMGREGRPLQ